MKLRAFLFNLDDRVKVWMAASAGAGAIYCADVWVQTAILAVCLALCGLCGAWRFAARFLLAVLILALASLALDRLASAGSNVYGRGLTYVLIKFGPLFAMMVFIQASLNTSRFLRSLEKLRVPAQWVIPIGVCLRFMPSVVAECRQIRYAMRIRGIGITPGRLLTRPFETIGYLMVPLLVRSLYIGDELARAAIARGIESEGPKTSLYDLKFRHTDAIFMLLWTLGIVSFLVWDHYFYAGRVKGAL